MFEAFVPSMVVVTVLELQKEGQTTRARARARSYDVGYERVRNHSVIGASPDMFEPLADKLCRQYHILFTLFSKVLELSRQ